MRKLTLKSVLSGVVAVCALMLMTGCDKIMSTLDNPVGSYVKVDTTTVVLSPGETLANRVASTISTETMTYKSSNPAVAKVDELSGVVTAVAVGEATITASVVGNEYYMEGKSSYKVKVISIALDKNEALIGVGDYQVLSATIAPADGFGLALNWTSSDEAIAKVDADGKVTAIAPGTAKITAEIGGKTAVCEVTAKAKINLAELNAPYEAQDGDILTGGTNYSVTIADGATIQLSGVSIYNWNSNNSPAISCAGNATIVLPSERGNTVSGSNSKAALQAGGAGTTLTIKGDGSLSAYSSSEAAAIGASFETVCGNIVIESGLIYAQSGSYGPGIGAGDGGTCGSITINGGRVTAVNTGSYGSGIGCGDAWHQETKCGDIIINGGEVQAQGGQYAAGIGSSATAYGHDNICGKTTINGGKVQAQGGAGAAGIGSGRAQSGSSICGNIAISDGEVTATGGMYAAGIGAGYAQSGSSSSCGNIAISGGKVQAINGNNAAGIGTGYAATEGNSTCGKIAVSGGEVTATGGQYAAGIGSGFADLGSSICSDIVITNGSVEATGGYWAAAIGTGLVNYNSVDYRSICGNITISGGTVVATKHVGATYSVGPGDISGSFTGTVGIVKVTVSVKDADGNDAVIYTPAAASAARRAAGKEVTLKVPEIKPMETKKL